MNKPKVSIIIPTFNEEINLELCLRSIHNQNYPLDKIEIIVVDDGSTDRTLLIAKNFGCRILHSGYKHIERSKSIGIRASRGKYLFLIDADIRLVDQKIILSSVNLLESNHHVTGVQCFYWKYSRKHTLINRYCELFGINDPFPFYLKKRGIRSFLDTGWIYPDTLIKQTKDFYLVQFNSNNLPTLGSQGYLCRSNSIKKYTHWFPYFFHLDVTKELVERNNKLFAIAKMSVEHDYADSIIEFYQKLYRNLELFYKYRTYRTYDYNIKSALFYVALIQMLTVVRPMIDSIRGYIKKPDIAWFLHPLFCFTVPVLYAFITVKYLFTAKEKKVSSLI